MLKAPAKILRQTLASLVLASAVIPGAIAGKDDKPERVVDMRYGVSLYEYFQSNYLDALSELHVAETLGGIAGHGNDPMLMRGGLSLAFGMEREAASIFQELLLQERPESIHNSAWYYLGKMRYRRGDWAGTADALANITDDQSKVLRRKLGALQMNLAIRLQDLDQAEALLVDNKRINAWLPYVYFNLGTAHIRQQRYQKGIGFLDQLAQLPLDSEEFLTLRDRAMTAAGYAMMLQKNYQEAVARFQAVRLNSPMVDNALLGYGWAAAEQGDYATALSPWIALGEQTISKPAVQEAMLAVPYAYEQLGVKSQALSAFESAEAMFTAQIERVEALKSELSPETLVAAMEQFGSEGDVDTELAGLVSLLSDDQFRLHTRDMRDLITMREKLVVWKRDLDIYKDLLVVRGQRREQRLSEIASDDHATQLTEMIATRDLLATEIERINQEHDVLAVANDGTRDLWQISEKALGAKDYMNRSGEKTSFESEQLRRYRGLLLWQAAEEFPDRVWQLKKKLFAVNEAVNEAVTNYERLEGIVERTPDITPYAERLSALEERLHGQLFSVNSSMKTTEGALRAMVLKELDAQRKRLRYYQSQARLAKARLYDTAVQGVN